MRSLSTLPAAMQTEEFTIIRPYENHQITAVDMYRENLDSDSPVHYPLVQGEHILLQNAAAGSAEENQ